MRCLVTGAKGFVGGYLVAALKTAGHEVFHSDIKSEISLDITDHAQCRSVISEYSPDVIYHLAAISFVPEAQADFDRTIKVNVSGTKNLLEATCSLANPSRFVYISSAEVYGRIKVEDLPIDETTNPKPANYYSLSKLMAESLVNYYFQEKGLSGVIFRPFNHIGAGQNENFVSSSFAKQLAEISKGKAEPVIMVGNLEAKRDFCAVEDVVEAYATTVQKGQGIYNLGSGQSVQIQVLLDTLIEIAGVEVEVKQDPGRMRPSQVAEIRCNPSKAEKELEWSRKVNLRDSLERVYHFWLNKV